MKRTFVLIASLLTTALVGLRAATPPPVRVLVWDEQQPEQKRAYGDKFLGETIAAHLAAQPGFTVKNVSLASPAQGLDEATLNDTDVLIWWSHVKNPFVTDDNVERIVTRVRQGKLGFIALHSAHWARPFVRLMQERAKDDALAQVPDAERATAKFEYFNQNPLGKVPPRNAPLTPALRQEDGVWKLTLPGCIFPAYRGDGAPSHVTTLLPEHPIAAGLPLKWDVAQTEMYDEPFHVPKPDAVVFEERWDKGEHFRSGCVWQVGKGRVFYFRPGHETFPVFKQAGPLRVMENAARWLARAGGGKSAGRSQASPAVAFDPVLRDIEGWKVHVDPALLDGAQREEGAKALMMLANHLQRIKILVPSGPLAKLQTIEIWIEHDHPKLNSMQYHPSRGWLVNNGHDPRLARKVHITQARELLSRSQMLKHPAVVLHELAHGYHDQILGFDHPDLAAAHRKARESGSYTNVLLYTGQRVKHYGLTDPMEYFAEGTEAYFYRNDFYPFVRAELKEHDPEFFKLLDRLWNGTAPSRGSAQVGPPPPELKLPAFYKKYLEADGYPIVASEKVNDYALKEAAYLVKLMLARRPDVRAAMIQSGSRLCVIAHNEFTTDLPEWARMKPKDYWDARARGTGGSADDPLCSSGEENLLAYPGDPYAAECILIHEFAHNIHLRGMVNVDPTFDQRVKAAYDAAMKAGLWKGKYASVNHHEYFAEGVQSWFDNNRVNDHDHNHVHLRSQLIEYDPGLATLCREVFGDTELKYTKPASRLRGHLAGYDPSTAPKFAWPERLDKARTEIKQKAQARSHAAENGANAAPKESAR